MGCRVLTTDIPDVKIILPEKFGDHRGFFSETYHKREFATAGIHLEFVHDNHALSGPKGTVRGLHFQTPPYEMWKLVRVVRGSIFDVAVDIRKYSPTYGKHVAVELSAEKWNQLLVPAGFAHGYCTLEPNTEVVYKVTNYYSQEHDKGILWNDEALGIRWPVEGSAALSEKDKKWPRLSASGVYFS